MSFHRAKPAPPPPSHSLQQSRRAAASACLISSTTTRSPSKTISATSTARSTKSPNGDGTVVYPPVARLQVWWSQKLELFWNVSSLKLTCSKCQTVSLTIIWIGIWDIKVIEETRGNPLPFSLFFIPFLSVCYPFSQTFSNVFMTPPGNFLRFTPPPPRPSKMACSLSQHHHPQQRVPESWLSEHRCLQLRKLGWAFGILGGGM